jgi:protein gp37
MGQTTIEWTGTPRPDGTVQPGYSFNAWLGCEKVSPACDHCYAERGSARIGAQHGLRLWGGDRFFTGEEYWRQPLRWNRAAERAGIRAKVFTNSYGDVFELLAQLRYARARLAGMVRSTPWLDWLFLTKRPENAESLWRQAWFDSWDGAGAFSFEWAPNIWLGTTVEDVARKSRIDVLRKIPTRGYRFLSIEPQLEDLGFLDLRGIHWVISGGESGPGARPFELDWARSIRRQCRHAGVAFFQKQLGAAASDPMNGVAGASLVVNDMALPLVSRRLRDKKGGDVAEWPADMNVREFPNAPIAPCLCAEIHPSDRPCLVCDAQTFTQIARRRGELVREREVGT